MDTLEIFFLTQQPTQMTAILTPDFYRATGLGVTIALCYRVDLPGMIRNPVANALGSTLGSFSGDLGTVIVFGLIGFVYDQYIWPNLRSTLGV